MLSAAILYMATHFDEPLFMGWAKLGGIVCGVADILVLFFLVKAAARITGRPISKWQTAFLIVCLGLVFLMLIPADIYAFFVCMFFALFPPYAYAIYIATRHLWKIADALKKLKEGKK